MDNLEQKLRKYIERKESDIISDEFLEKLKSLETVQNTTPRPCRRFVLPIAALITIVLLLGSGLIYLHFLQPDKFQTLDSNGTQIKTGDQTLAEPTDPTQEMPTPAEPEQPAPVTPDGTIPVNQNDPTNADPDQPAPVTPDGMTTVKQNDPTPEKPEQSTPAKTDDGMPAEPDNPRPEKPNDPIPAKPDDATWMDPQDTSSQLDDQNTPVSVQPEDQIPSIPIEPDPPENPNLPVEMPPTEDLPAPSEPPEIGAVYLSEGCSETLILTLMSTGESVEVDVTGWIEKMPTEDIPQPGAPHSSHGRSDLRYYGSCVAFGKTVNYCLMFDEYGTVLVEVDVMNPE